ncbi:TATA box-binding protein-associated factor RNA polymerase I subunit A-like [Lytechinus variegatus]|uniref:TATA box-binding protein-associated factor RNA polymerase I subunit A-like n=1 Tax=Lytechinus variegatus TaxID=7654 RepID=UPI001BB19D43|nr:TATA box-binding protein-associated factor RNA polymerase I subunit A-like [Lytechinus variegatus]XP_041467870.1 TATA box-binding protein-associated factor RNA polymerase I subunit A-like [Lytechinus variegatus]XP_041467871.1 TATA box-binding protein-associated factor RNA polymerase I subunit A-like [Lytechinus variegatus]
MKSQNSVRKKQRDKPSDRNRNSNLIKSKQNGHKKKKKISEKQGMINITNTSSKNKGNAKNKKETVKGSQSSLLDFVSPVEKSKSKKKKRNDQTDDGSQQSLLDFISPKQKKRRGIEKGNCVKEKETKEISETRKCIEGESSASISGLKKKVPKKRTQEGGQSKSKPATDPVLEQKAFKKKKKKKHSEHDSNSSSIFSRDSPQENKQKPGSEQQDPLNTKGKDLKESNSSAPDLAKAKKRKVTSEVLPERSKRRKEVGSPQQTLEEKRTLEDAFLFQHTHISNYIRGELYSEVYEGSSFTAMSSMLKECILQEKWEDSIQILCAQCTYQRPDIECLWKFGAHVLQNHPDSNAEQIEDLYRFVRKINTTNPYQKKLEHALFLLRQDRMKDALTTLSEMWPASKKCANKESNQPEIRKKLISANAGLIEYCQWHEKIKGRGDDEVVEDATLRKRALTNLGKFNNEPGVWDIFITKQVEMLETKEGSINKAEQILNNYLSNNPGNPNAHVYLYQFIKRNKPTKTNKLKTLLKKLATLLPASDYTLEYVDLLEKTESAELAEVLPLIFNMADYSTCRYHIALWKTLVEHILPVVESKDKPAKAILKKCWSSRKSWWTSYHFDRHGVAEMANRHPEIAVQKAILAAIFYGSDYPFVRKVQKAIQEIRPELSKELEDETSLWSNPAV